MAKRKRLSLAFGAYAGFKLLFPAGPLIIATSLGVSDPSLFAYCFVVFIPVWAVGLIYSRIIESKLAPAKEQNSYQSSPSSFTSLLPFVLLMVLLASGVLFDLSFNPLLDYAVNPKGALMLTAALALFMIPKLERRDCIDIGILRTGSLLLLIGAASALSAFVTAIIPIAQIFTPQNSIMALISLFIMPALFKLLQGSSMSAFAAVGPVAAPIVVASEVSPIAAVLAICLGSFVAILPNDSFYWLIRRSVMKDESEFNVINILGCGSLLQAMIGLAILIAFQHIALG